MIFAEMTYPQDYADIHAPLLACISAHFARVESGLQGDSWIWVFSGESKVAIDTFSSMKHQIKSDKAAPLVQQVIETIKRRYEVRVYETPELEGHEEA